MEWEREESTGRHFLWWQEYSGEGNEAVEGSTHQLILSQHQEAGPGWQ